MSSPPGILAAFAERGIRFVKDSLVKALNPGRKAAVLSDGTEMGKCRLHLLPHTVAVLTAVIDQKGT
ncbi:MAG: hypothetical protein DMG98_24435 [Acidobacteria bacterium]|nr:MAG: hypothetical protein DMG98_24435 [Acidobacteriota bacterium]